MQHVTIPEADRRFDAVAMEIFSNRLLSITEMMAINMMRASFSSQIKERRDFSVGIFSPEGQLIAQGTHIPVHLGSLMGGVEGVLRRYPLSEIRPGDAFICNDPYVAGGTHLPDISITTPVFLEGRLVAFVANIGHHTDVGGAIPGSTSPSARSIFEEGLRLPVMRVAREGVVDQDLLEMIGLNSRLSEERILDLRVQIATNEKGIGSVLELIGRMGTDGFRAAVDDLLSYTRRRLQLRIAALGTEVNTTFTAWLDDDGFPDGDMLPLKVTVTVEDGRIVLDFAGTGPEARGALNVAENALRASVYYSLKALLDPDLMANSGMMDAVIIRAPLGTIVNPRPPAATGARTIACQRLTGAIFGAFQSLLAPEQRIGTAYDTLPSINFAGRRPQDGSYYVCGESMGGGGAARNLGDGMDGIHVHITNSLNLPCEAWEHEFPLVVEEYALVEGSGGAGRHRGGMGIARQVRVLHDGAVISARSDRHKKGAPGTEGAGSGGLGRLIRNPGTPDEQLLPSKVAAIQLRAGEVIRIETPGGGGYGPAEGRAPAALARDLRDGILTRDAALEAYGEAALNAALACAL